MLVNYYPTHGRQIHHVYVSRSHEFSPGILLVLGDIKGGKEQRSLLPKDRESSEQDATFITIYKLVIILITTIISYYCYSNQHTGHCFTFTFHLPSFAFHLLHKQTNKQMSAIAVVGYRDVVRLSLNITCASLC